MKRTYYKKIEILQYFAVVILCPKYRKIRRLHCTCLRQNKLSKPHAVELTVNLAVGVRLSFADNFDVSSLQLTGTDNVKAKYTLKEEQNRLLNLVNQLSRSNTVPYLVTADYFSLSVK